MQKELLLLIILAYKSEALEHPFKFNSMLPQFALSTQEAALLVSLSLAGVIGALVYLKSPLIWYLND